MEAETAWLFIGVIAGYLLCLMTFMAHRWLDKKYPKR